MSRCGRAHDHGSPRDLQHRIFRWLVGSVLVTTLLVGGLVRLFHAGGAPFDDEIERFEALVSDRFARVWDDAAAREQLATNVAERLDAVLWLEGEGGEDLGRFGEGCDEPIFTVPVRGPEARLGTLHACTVREHPRTFLFFVALFTLFACVWATAGFVARRLARPLAELAEVAESVGRDDALVTVERRQPSSELVVLATAIDEMQHRIHEQLDDQKELLAAVSHEIRTPLGHVRILLETARERGEDQVTLDALEREVLEIDGLVDELLASSRLDFGSLETCAVEPAAAAQRALVRAGLDPALLVLDGIEGPLQADPTLLGRALANLLTNAERHGTGVVELRVHGSVTGVRFEVRDGGPGFAGDPRRAFDPFYRDAGGRSRAGSSLGLGLTLVERIASAHGGEVFAENLEGGGALVGLSLPSGTTSDLRAGWSAPQGDSQT